MNKKQLFWALCICGFAVPLIFAHGVVGHPSNASSIGEYEVLKNQMAAIRDSIGRKYQERGETDRDAHITRSRRLITTKLTDEFFPAWYGTPWDFNGTTQKPREGKIACGYFVTTVLRDAGFDLERVRLAQQPSLKIIQSLCPKTDIWDFAGITVHALVERFDDLPEGIFVVGLDIHTGFIVHKGKTVDFVHASYGNPSVVVREAATKSAVLAQSRRFVLGRVDNNRLLIKWLTKEHIPTL